MQVIWVTQSAANSVIGRTDTQEIPRCLTEMGHTVHLIVASTSEIKRKTVYVYHNTTQMWVPNKGALIGLFFVGQLLGYLLYRAYKHKADVLFIDVACAFGAVPLAILSRLGLCKTKLILNIRTCPIDVRGIMGRARQIRYDWSLRMARRLFHGATVIVESLRQDLHKMYGYDLDNIEVWASGVSLELFNPDEVEAMPKQEVGLDGKFVVLHHGTPRRDFGLEAVIRAIRILKDQGYPIGFLVLGSEGAIHEHLLKVVVQESVEDRVYLKPPVPSFTDVPPLVAMCDVGINTPPPQRDWWKPQSYVKVMEYMAMRKPMVLSDIVAHRDVVGDAQCAVFVSRDEPGEIARALVRLYEQRERLNEIGKAGREVVQTKYTWMAQAKKVESYFQKVLGA